MKPVRSPLPAPHLRLLGAYAAALLALAALATDAYAQNSPPVRWQGGIGSQPLRATAPGVPGTPPTPPVVASNDAFGVNPGGRPWVISELHATLRGNRLRVEGRGLLIAGGDTTGTGTVASVRARLACPNPPPNPQTTPPTPLTFTYFDSTPVKLEADGDFKVDEMLTVPAGTKICDSPGLLIINGTSAAWFAAGIPKR